MDIDTISLVQHRVKKALARLAKGEVMVEELETV